MTRDEFEREILEDCQGYSFVYFVDGFPVFRDSVVFTMFLSTFLQSRQWGGVTKLEETLREEFGLERADQIEWDVAKELILRIGNESDRVLGDVFIQWKDDDGLLYNSRDEFFAARLGRIERESEAEDDSPWLVSD